MANETYKIDDFEYFMITNEDGKKYLAVKGYKGNATDLKIPPTVTIDGNEYPVTEIGDCAFAECKSLESVTIPDSVTRIGHDAFDHCISLKSVNIPSSVTTIVEDAFYGCKSLESVTIQNGTTTIGAWAFCECSSLTSVTIPDSVTEIGEEAFYGCNGLTSITIQNGATTIGENAFGCCTKLKELTLPKSWENKGKEELNQDLINMGIDPSQLKEIKFGSQNQEQAQDMEKTRLEKFATSSLKMFPKELCKILEEMSDNDVLGLMQIYDQHLSQSHDAWERNSLILNMALTARETERIGNLTSQTDRELTHSIENMLKAFKESKIEERSTILNVMQMTQEDMSTEHITKLEKGHLTGRVETLLFDRLKMIDAEARGETISAVTERIESVVTTNREDNMRLEQIDQPKFTVADLANASKRGPSQITATSLRKPKTI